MHDYLKYLPIISVLIIYALRMKEVLTKRNTIKGEIKETLTFQLFMLSGLITAAGGIAEFVLRNYSWSLMPFIIGWICGISSFLIRWSTIKALGNFWSLHNELRDSHQFVQTGPFRWMRHPTYFSMILELMAGVLILSAPVAALVAFLIFFPTLIYRIKTEERLLIKKFGDAYLIYKECVPTILPKLPTKST